MKTRTTVLILAIITMLFLVAACSSGTASSTTATSNSSSTLDGATLFQERCSVCHKLPTNEQMTANQWKATVESMVTRGANLSQEEQQLVIDYLTANYGK